jgi:GNAT superfamily N-acetyltransferase
MPPASPLGVCVRRATAQDVPALVALINRAYEVERFFVDGDRTGADEVHGLRAHGDFLVLDRPGDGLAASVHVSSQGGRGHFGMLSVAPDLQGLGLGRRLVTVAEALCTAQGCVAMDIEVVALLPALHAWYRSLGYREHGTAPFPVPSRLPCHYVLMSKPLAGTTRRA